MNTSYKLVLGLGVVVAVAVGGVYAWRLNVSNSTLANISDATKISDEQVTELVARVGKFLVVPGDEKPSVVVIKDVEKLAEQQSFYKGAKNGDILLIYSSRAIIYDAKANKLVNVGPIVRNDNPAASPDASVSPNASPTATPKLEAVTVDVRNGTTTAGLAGATASDLKKNKLVTIGKVGDAKGSFKATVVVDLTKDSPGKSATIADLAKTLGATVVTTLPDGELASTADALVITGK